jgi:hypothetical protein
MQRRHLLTVAGMVLVPAASASHGWKPFAEAPPFYLEGEVTNIIWADPHPHLELVQRVGAKLPQDLRQRDLPPHRGRDMNELLLRAVMPAATERRWRVELPELHRLLAWGMPRPKTGYQVGVVGLPGPWVSGTPTVQAEIVFMGPNGYPLRANPL